MNQGGFTVRYMGTNPRFSNFYGYVEKDAEAAHADTWYRVMGRHREDITKPEPYQLGNLAPGYSPSKYAPEVVERTIGKSLGPDNAFGFLLKESVMGLVVKDLTPGGHALSAGVEVGDSVQAVDRRPVYSLEEWRAAMHGKNVVVVEYWSKRRGRKVAVELRL
eukprot:EG_transcript_29106